MSHMATPATRIYGLSIMDNKARERSFQDHIVHALQASGWLVGESTKYDRERALYLEDLANGARNIESRRHLDDI